MKVSLNWAQSVANVDLKSVPTDQLLKKIGAQLGAIEEVTDWGSRFEGLVVVKVVSCSQHPNADKLHVCLVDDGNQVANVDRNADGLVQVVCGAPNVHADMLAVWLPPGSTVPSTINKDPFVLGARELRGVTSSGMLASTAELGINDNHDGILEIDPSEVGDDLAKAGTEFKKLYNLDDIVIDCENKMFTHRPDCFGILGVARELAGITGQKFTSPSWYLDNPKFNAAHDLQISGQINTDLSPRLMLVAMNNVSVGDSSTSIQADLTKVGIRPINNVVDITNWLMHLTAQPLHAYDYDKLLLHSNSDKLSLQVRAANENEKISLLNGKTIELDPSTLVIATDKAPVGIAGVMGGADTEVDANTKRIVIEVAGFDMYSVRKSSMRYGLFTDAVTRFNKGQSPLQNDRVLAQAMRLMSEVSGATQASEVIDIQKSELVKPLATVTATAEFINSRLGSDLSLDKMKSLLSNVECHDASKVQGQVRSYIMGVGNIDDKLTRLGIKIVEKTDQGHYKVLIPLKSLDDYEKLIGWELKPGMWNEYIGVRNVFMFKTPDTKVVRYEVADDTEHEIVEMCRSFNNEYYTSIDSMLSSNSWYKDLLPISKNRPKSDISENSLSVIPPFWRRDIEQAEDLVEEIGRLYGFDKLDIKLPTRLASAVSKNPQLELNAKIRRILSSAGASEVLTYSFVHGKVFDYSNQSSDLAFHIRNALSPGLQYYRQSVVPSLLDKVHMNIKAGANDFVIYEIGKGHYKASEEDQKSPPQPPEEIKSLAVVYASNTKQDENPASAYFAAKQYLQLVADSLGLELSYKAVDADVLDLPVTKPFEPSRSALVIEAGSHQTIGIVGEFIASSTKGFKLPVRCSGFELDIDLLLELSGESGIKYMPINKFPKSLQDATYEVNSNINYEQVYSSLISAARKNADENNYSYKITPSSIYKPDDSDKLRYSFSVELWHDSKTLTTAEVSDYIDSLSRKLVADFSAKRV